MLLNSNLERPQSGNLEVSFQPENDVGCAAEAAIQRVRPIYAVAKTRHSDATPGLSEYQYPFSKVEG
jgi:hypothetical protein